MIGGTRSVPVLITGCSSGIGRAAALSLHAAGLAVYATARQVDALADLAAHGLHTLALDVTDEASMTDARSSPRRSPPRGPAPATSSTRSRRASSP
jgi:NADP-dependent 3-hydroxy acid dehydrogenase YdfG